MTTLGQVLLAISAVAAFASIGALVWGHRLGRKEGEGLTNTGYIATFVIAGSMTLALLVLVIAFFRKDFTFLYVALNHSTDVSGLSWLYNLSGVWAGREGSLFFWAWLLSVFAAWMAYKRLDVTDALSNIGLAITNFVQIFFLIALFIETNNPFRTAVIDAAGNLTSGVEQFGNINVLAMNPLLQHWAMILHPPALFIGYAGLTIPFAYALAAVLLGDSSKKWVEIVDRTTVFSWLMLGIGIGLGSIWAYVVLGWGGFWAWDPVENASLLPWLTGVGLLHSFTVYKRREGFKMWAVMMAAVTFVLVLLGTFITRSGVIQSVHSFKPDNLSLWWFLSMMVLSLAVTAIALFGFRAKEFGSDDEFESIISKEGSYYFNNVLMLLAAILVAGMTLAPAFKGPTFNAATFDLLARPIGILYVAIMAICPLLSWNKTDPATFWSRAKWPLGGAAVLATGFLTVWATVMLPNYTPSAKRLPNLTAILPAVDHTEAVIGILVASLAIALPIYLFIDGARKRASAKGESFGSALGSIIFKARSQSGGYITHLGIGIILIGLIGSTMYVKDVQFFLKEQDGAKQSVGGYDFIFRGFSDVTLPNGDGVSKAKIDVQQGGRSLGRMTPGMTQFANRPPDQNSRLDAAVDVQLLRDLFVVFQGSDQARGLSFDVKINPMISWAWAGFLITILGAAIAMWPKKPRTLEAVPVPRKKKAARR